MERIRSYTITAIPDQVGTTGQRRFYSARRARSIQPTGSADATSQVIQ